MKLSARICPHCGGSKLVEKAGGIYCPYCGHTFVPEYLDAQEALLAALGEVKQEMLSNARRMLYDAVHAEDVSSEKVIAGAREVKKYISDDFMANFYAAACEEDVRSVNHFLERADVAKQDKFFLFSVCDFMLRSLEKRNVGALKDFIDRAHRSGIFTSGEYTKYISRIEEEAEKLDKGVYDADLPRDVFIAYSSKDMAEVNELTDFLEGEGFSCFVALRNLRHGKGAAENYQRLLETAMRSCKSVVFISTGNSRDRSCDALGVELPYFRDHLPEIYRVEYRPASDNGKMTMGAKYLLEKFFENLEYARTPEDVLKRLLDHEYGFDKTTQAPAQISPPPSESSEDFYEEEKHSAANKDNKKTVRNSTLSQKLQPQPTESADKLYDEGKKYYDAKEYEKAVEYFRKAAAQGHANAQNIFGTCYYYGQGVPQDYEKAVEWYNKAAEQGHARAQCNLGVCYEFGQGVPQSYEKAVEWYRKAAEQGHARAQCNLGVCYEYGQGVPQSYEKAVEWYRKAAEQGYSWAQNNLGVCYEYGQGVPQDYEKAVEWYRKAAEQGYSWAQNNLGTCYYYGHGVPQSYEKAVEWYRKAAEQGYSWAQNNLGTCYYYGHGVPQSYEKAVEWYRKAAAQGHEGAQKALARLKR